MIPSPASSFPMFQWGGSFTCRRRTPCPTGRTISACRGGWCVIPFAARAAVPAMLICDADVVQDDAKYCIGNLTHKTRLVRCVNTLTKDEHLLEVRACFACDARLLSCLRWHQGGAHSCGG